MKVCYLEIHTWAGLSLGAQHYYAKLRYGNERCELERTLTERGAQRMNKAWDTDTFKAGDSIANFETYEQAVQAGREQWKQHFPDADILVRGMRYIAEPQEILEGPEEIKAKVNGWWKELQDMGPAADDAAVDQIEDTFWEYWQEIVEKRE